MSSGFIHVVARVKVSGLFKAQQYSMVWIDLVLLIVICRWALGCFRVLAVVNNAVRTCVYKYLPELLLLIFNFGGGFCPQKWN